MKRFPTGPAVILMVMLLPAGCSRSGDTVVGDTKAPETTAAPTTTSAPVTTVLAPVTATTEASLAAAIEGLAGAIAQTTTTVPTTVAPADRSVEDLQDIADRAGSAVIIRVSDDYGTTTVTSGETAGGRRVTADDAFSVASITKTMTAAVTVTLAEDGVLGLDDPAADHLDYDISPDITIRHLLAHQSGIADGMTPDGGAYSTCDPSIVRRLSAIGPEFEPGSKAVYSNGGYLVLGSVIGTVTGEDISVAFEDRVFGPLGMTSTYFVESQDGPTPLHAIDERYTCPRNKVTFWTHAGVISTADDLDAFLRGLFEADLLTDESRDQMLDFQLDMEPGYGLGVGMWEGTDGRRLYGHMGVWQDTQAAALYEAASHRTIVMYVQDGSVDQTSWKVAAWAEGG